MIFVLRLLHILSGLFWVGAVLFNSLILLPSIRAAGPAGGAVMAQLGRRRMPVIMMANAVVTVISGIWLMTIVSAGDLGAWMRSGPGRTFALGGAIAILTLVGGMIVNLPTASRMGAINQAVLQRGGAPTPDEAAALARLQARLAVATQVVAVLLVLATAAMAVARYLPS